MTQTIAALTPWHHAAISLLIEMVTCLWHDREAFFAGGNMFLYYRTRHLERRVSRGERDMGRLYDSSGKLVPLKAETAEMKADAAEKKAEAAEMKAEAAEMEVARLKALLANKGIVPEA